GRQRRRAVDGQPDGRHGVGGDGASLVSFAAGGVGPLLAAVLASPSRAVAAGWRETTRPMPGPRCWTRSAATPSR
ncbi:hypothetical protein, partial [Burkholderia sp.]|uniref:hypothetical protein n=1 Tax=Burkholderia sp. TaxID=36773 RepID=UPI00258BFCDC